MASRTLFSPHLLGARPHRLQAPPPIVQLKQFPILRLINASTQQRNLSKEVFNACKRNKSHERNTRSNKKQLLLKYSARATRVAFVGVYYELPGKWPLTLQYINWKRKIRLHLKVQERKNNARREELSWRKRKEEKKLASPGSHSTRNGVRTHVCIRTLELKSNALTTRPPWYATDSFRQIANFIHAWTYQWVSTALPYI